MASSNNDFTPSNVLAPQPQHFVTDQSWLKSSSSEDDDIMEPPYMPCLSSGSDWQTAGYSAGRAIPTPQHVSLRPPRDTAYHNYATKPTPDDDQFWSTPSPNQTDFALPDWQSNSWQVPSMSDRQGDLLGPEAHGLYTIGSNLSPMQPSTIAMPVPSIEYSMANDPASFYSSCSSTGASDMFEAMALGDRSSHWSTEGPQSTCVSAPALSVNSTPWAQQVQQQTNATVSPKLLRINPTPTPASSTESIHTTLLVNNDNIDSPLSAFDLRPRLQQQQQQQHQQQQQRAHMQAIATCGPEQPAANHHNKAARKQLPDKAPHPHPQHIVNHDNGGHSTGRTPSVSPPKTHKLKPRVGPPPAPPVSPESQEKLRKDDYLVKSKLAGMTYKDIKRKGNFTEAESTLRGRFRTLTKNKEARVRKPEWEEKDDRLLDKAVRKLAKGDRIPWKQVAEYIVDHGGSYHFGNTTCRKRWDMLECQETKE